MAKAAAKSQLDVLIVGSHCSALIAAAALKHDHPKLAIAQASLPGEEDGDRLTVVNPKLFSLHPVLKGLSKEKAFTETFGLQFLSESPASRGEFVSKSATALVVSTDWFTEAAARIASSAGVDQRIPKSLSVTRVLDDGVEVSLDGHTATARTLIVAASLPTDARRTLGIPTHGDDDVTHHYRFVRWRGTKSPANMPANGTIPMSLDLAGTGAWAWALRNGEAVQLSVMQPARAQKLPAGRDVGAWIANLADHGILMPEARSAVPEQIATVHLPVAGALVSETVANRTLLIGPAGGFVSACAEEIYPSCWSAVLAASAAAKALKSRHVQDALCDYRSDWGSTLGDYLRGPQQNLKLLLPLVYRNAIMSARVAEAILLGESVVR